MRPEISNELAVITSTSEQTARPSRSRRVLWGCLTLAMFALVAWTIFGHGVDSNEMTTVRELVWQFCEEDDPNSRRELAERTEALLNSILNRGSSDSSDANVLQTALLFERGRLAEAARFRSRISMSSCAPEDLALAAVIFAQAQEFAFAEQFVNTATTRSSEALVLRAAAMAYQEMNRDDDVFLVCQKWSQSDMANPEPLRRILQVHENQGLIHLSADVCRQLLERSINNRNELQLKYINLLIQMGNTVDARRQFVAATSERPQESRLKFAPTLDWLVTEVRLNHAEGAIPQARQLLEQALAADPRHFDALLLHGQLLLSASEVMNAIQVLKQAVNQRPLDGQAHYLLGQAYGRSQQRELAETELALFRQLRNTAPQIRYLERVVARRPEDLESRRKLKLLQQELAPLLD